VAPLVVSACSLLAGLATLAVEVEGSVTCPSPAEVAARLRPLLRGEVLDQAGDRVRLDRHEGVLRVAVVRADGQVRGVRNVDERHDCAELAEAAAVIVASWQPEAGLASGLGVPEATASARAADLRAPAAPISGDEPRFEAGVGALADFSGARPAPGVGFEGGWGPAARGLALHLRAQGSQWQQLALVGGDPGHPQGGDVRWRRLPLAVGPAWRWPGTLALELDLSLAAAWLSVKGDGFVSNQRHDALDLGASAGLRLSWRGRLRPLFPFLGVSGTFWPRKTVAQEMSSQGSAALPRGEVGLVLGVAYGR
jgi:hypothetical protein